MIEPLAVHALRSAAPAAPPAHPRMKVCEDVLIYPHPMPPLVPDPAIDWFHGPEEREDIPLEGSGHLRFGRSVLRPELRARYAAGTSEERLAGRWLYAGPLLNHFGHFLSECVHRLWAWRHLEDSVDGIVFVPWANPGRFDPARMGRFFHDFLKLVGIPAERLHFADRLVRVDELVVVQPGSHLGAVQPSWYLDELRSFVGEEDLPAAGAEKIFFSRRHFLDSGKLAGLDAVESLYARRGFEIVFPEQLPLAEQLGAVLHAERIAWEEGSNLHVLEVLRPIGAHATLFKRRPTLLTFDLLLAGKTHAPSAFGAVTVLPDLARLRDVDGETPPGGPPGETSRTSLSVASTPDALVDFVDRELELSEGERRALRAEIVRRQTEDFRRHAENLGFSGHEPCVRRVAELLPS